jgi:hypothetical protein
LNIVYILYACFRKHTICSAIINCGLDFR